MIAAVVKRPVKEQHSVKIIGRSLAKEGSVHIKYGNTILHRNKVLAPFICDVLYIVYKCLIRDCILVPILEIASLLIDGNLCDFRA